MSEGLKQPEAGLQGTFERAFADFRENLVAIDELARGGIPEAEQARYDTLKGKVLDTHVSF